MSDEQETGYEWLNKLGIIFLIVIFLACLYAECHFKKKFAEKAHTFQKEYSLPLALSLCFWE